MRKRLGIGNYFKRSNQTMSTLSAMELSTFLNSPWSNTDFLLLVKDSTLSVYYTQFCPRIQVVVSRIPRVICMDLLHPHE